MVTGLKETSLLQIMKQYWDVKMYSHQKLESTAAHHGMEEMCSPFAEETGDLRLDTKDIVDSFAAQLIAAHHERGKQQFKI